MQLPDWILKKPNRGEKLREASQGAHFASGSLSNIGEALIRESIQNSLDAIEDVTKPVEVSFMLSDGSSISDESMAYWFDGLKPHVEAAGSEILLSNSLDCENENFKFLSIEDFNTKGLQGNHHIDYVDDQNERPEDRNWFWYFWRTEGRSPKRGEGRGKWGLGKFVYPASSSVRAFFGLTISKNENPRLMGQTVLCAHRINGEQYTCDGDWGINDGGFVIPVTTTQTIRKFSEDFSLSRTSENGFSIVIPWVSGDLDFEGICKHVIANFLQAIAANELRVSVKEGQSNCEINQDTIELILGEMDDVEFKEKWLGYYYLFLEGETRKESDFYHLQPPEAGTAPRWNRMSMKPENVEELKEKIHEGEEILAFRVPIAVQRLSGQADEPSCFSVILQRATTRAKGGVVFLRDSLRISEERSRPKVTEFRAIVFISSGPLSVMLSHCEGPAHLHWDHHMPGIKSGRYKNVKSCLDFVRQSVNGIIALIRNTSDSPDFATLSGFFPWNEAAGENAPGGSGGKGTKKKKRSPKPPKLEGGIGVQIRIERYQGGFKVLPGPNFDSSTVKIRIRVAYDTSRGNPFSKFSEFDFNLRKMACKYFGLTREFGKLNVVTLTDLSDDFSFALDGFDRNRDLVVQARMEKTEREE